MKTHSGQKSNICNQCDFASSHAQSLKAHLKTHSGDRSNKCNQCEFASAEQSDLRKHLKTHSGEKQKKSVSFPEDEVTEVIEIPFTKFSVKEMTSELVDFFDELEKPITIAHNRGQKLLCSELVQCYELNSRKNFDVHKYRILATFGLYANNMGPKGMEVTIDCVGKLDSSMKSTRRKHLISEIERSQESSKFYVDLITLPEPVTAKYIPARQLIESNILQVAPLPPESDGPKTLLQRVRRRQAEKAHRETVFNSHDWQLKALPELARVCNGIFVSERRRVIQMPKLLEKISQAGFSSLRPLKSDLQRLINVAPDFLSIPISGFVRREEEDVNKVCTYLDNLK